MIAPEKIVTDIRVATAPPGRPALAAKTGPSVPKAPFAMPTSRMPMKETGEFR